jgi:flagellar M-ring protein FliF
MGALADAGALPHDFGAYLRKALDQSGVFISAKERQERLKVALQDELAGIIRGMQGIEKASVLYDKTTRPGLGRETIATASVSVKPVGSQPLDESRVRGIRHLVASSVAELKPELVSVTDLNGRTYAATGDGELNGESDAYRERRNAYERDLKEKIVKTLSYVSGISVGVNVELDTEVRRNMRTTEFAKDKSIIGSQNEKTLEETKETATTAGPPGTRSNNANEPAAVAATAKGGNSTKNQSENKQETLPGGTFSTSEAVGLTPKRVTVSISVPRSHFENIWRRQTNATDSSQKPDDNAVTNIERDEILKMREMVAALLPVRPVGDPIAPVTIKSFADLPTSEIAEPPLTSNILAWVGQYWSTLGMTFLGLFSLLMLRSMVRSTANDSVSTMPNLAMPTPTGAPASPQSETEEAVAKEPGARLLKRHEGGPSLRDELAELIREDPDAAANVLRSWIGTAT